MPRLSEPHRRSDPADRFNTQLLLQRSHLNGSLAQKGRVADLVSRAANCRASLWNLGSSCGRFSASEQCCAAGPRAMEKARVSQFTNSELKKKASTGIAYESTASCQRSETPDETQVPMAGPVLQWATLGTRSKSVRGQSLSNRNCSW